MYKLWLLSLVIFLVWLWSSYLGPSFVSSVGFHQDLVEVSLFLVMNFSIALIYILFHCSVSSHPVFPTHP